MLLGDRVAVNTPLDELLEARHVQHILGVGARRNDEAAQTGFLSGFEVAPRVVEHLDAVVLDRLDQQLILAIANAIDGVRVRLVVGFPVGEVDTPRMQEVAHPVGAWFAVDVVAVVAVGELALTVLGQDRIEGLLPRLAVHGRSIGEDTVQIEQARGHGFRQSEHHPSIPLVTAALPAP